MVKIACAQMTCTSVAGEIACQLEVVAHASQVLRMNGVLLEISGRGYPGFALVFPVMFQESFRCVDIGLLLALAARARRVSLRVSNEAEVQLVRAPSCSPQNRRSARWSRPCG